MATDSSAPPLSRGDKRYDAIGEAEASLGVLIDSVERRLLSPDDEAVLRKARRLLAQLADDAEAERAHNDPEEAQSLYFDVSDLLDYWPHNRLPTGVQRVQANTVLAILDEPFKSAVGLCCFSERHSAWLSVPVSLFRAVCGMSVVGGDAIAADWRAQVATLDTAINSGASFSFPQDAYLINLGTSWWVENYFIHVREAKRKSGIRFIPFIHDMIPILFPDYCIPDLVHEFVDWFVGVVRYADAFLVNSNATKADLIRLAGLLDRAISEADVAMIPLAADPVATSPTSHDARITNWGLRPGSFVLFVSTIEIRKNQLGALNAWQRLIALHGREKVPTLVCVGKRGYRSDQVIARLDNNPDLRDRVLLLDGIDDQELSALYDGSLFTTYPSFYEGWGLPVTESLRHGKVPLIADNSSLPQAGGGLAMAFETGSLVSYVEALEILIFDPAERRRREEEIRKNYRTRSWQHVARDLASSLERLAVEPNGKSAAAAIVVVPGYYPLTRNHAFGLEGLRASAEPFRDGTGWWKMEKFGTWTKAGGGRLRLRFSVGEAKVAIKLASPAGHASNYRITVNDGWLLLNGKIEPDVDKWVTIELPAEVTGDDVTLDFTSRETRVVSDGVNQPPREIGIGVCGFFVFDLTKPRHHIDFIEAVALGSLQDYQLAAGALG